MLPLSRCQPTPWHLEKEVPFPQNVPLDQYLELEVWEETSEPSAGLLRQGWLTIDRQRRALQRSDQKRATTRRTQIINHGLSVFARRRLTLAIWMHWSISEIQRRVRKRVQVWTKHRNTTARDGSWRRRYYHRNRRTRTQTPTCWTKGRPYGWKNIESYLRRAMKNNQNSTLWIRKLLQWSIFSRCTLNRPTLFLGLDRVPELWIMNQNQWQR